MDLRRTNSEGLEFSFIFFLFNLHLICCNAFMYNIDNLFPGIGVKKLFYLERVWQEHGS